MNRHAAFCLALAVMAAQVAIAQLPESFDRAKALASRSGKPLLLEFYHDD